MKTLFAFLLCLIYCVSKSQSVIKINGHKSIEEYFNTQYYDPIRKEIYPYTIDTLCQSGSSFLSFVITKSGSISNVSFDKNTPLALIDMLRPICHQSNGKWIIDESVNEDSLQILIPVYYNFYLSNNKNCKTIKNDYQKSAFSMMSAFKDSELIRNRYAAIEKTEQPKHIWLLSPLYFHTIVYFHNNSKNTGQ